LLFDAARARQPWLPARFIFRWERTFIVRRLSCDA
jgi:hypothetical protein